MRSDVLTLYSYAKINIGLQILGKREDGYHDIETIFQEIDLHDIITLNKQSKGIDVTCNHSLVPNGAPNLAYQAAALLKNTFSIEEGVRISIDKNIPVSAGLGGGSSNAATVLKGLEHLWELGLNKTELKALAAEIGSDVPFFIEGGTALACGRGEILKELESFPPFICLIIYPNIQISTGWSYKNFNLYLTKTKKSVKLFETFFKDIKLSQFRDIFINALENVAFTKYPILNDLKKKLYLGGAEFVSMSGSGSAIYGLFNSNNLLQKARREFNRSYQIFITNPIRRRSCNNHWTTDSNA